VVHVRGRIDVRGPDGELWTNTTLQTALAGRRAVISAYDDDVIPHVLLMRRDGSLRALPRYDGPLRMPAITFTRTDTGPTCSAGRPHGSRRRARSS
jgi:hypothetical protein